MADIEKNNYTDLNTLMVGTRFRVDNGAWEGQIILKGGKRYYHIFDTNEDKLVTGKEDFIITTL